MALEIIKRLIWRPTPENKTDKIQQKWSECILLKRERAVDIYLCKLTNSRGDSLYCELNPFIKELEYGEIKIPISHTESVSATVVTHNREILVPNRLDLFGYPMSPRTKRFELNVMTNIFNGRDSHFLITHRRFNKNQLFSDPTEYQLAHSAEAIVNKFNEDFRELGMKLEPLAPASVGI